MGDAQNQLTQSESELNKTLDRNRTMERQQLELENQVEGLQQEINNLKANMTHLDQEKDQLLVSIRYNYIAKYSTTLTYDVMNK